MVAENKGVVDSREHPVSMLFLFPCVFLVTMLYKLDFSSIQPIEFIEY